MNKIKKIKNIHEIIKSRYINANEIDIMFFEELKKEKCLKVHVKIDDRFYIEIIKKEEIKS